MKKIFFSCVTFVLLIIISCNNDIEKQVDLSNPESKMSARVFTADSTMLQNPYSVRVMQTALQNIISRGTYDTGHINSFRVTTTHKYIKFNPRNKADEELLKDDTNMYLFDYRLDCEYSDKYLQNRKPDNDSIPNYYTAVTIDKVLPNVPYVVLENLYIPEQDDFFDDIVDQDRYVVNYEINTKSDLFYTLISDAHEQTDNYDNVGYIDQNSQQKLIFGKRWRPAGKIRVEDTTKNVIYPIEGAKVLIRQGFTITSGITNANGDFSTGHVRGCAKYVIQWERYHFSVRSGVFGQAETKSNNMLAQNWNCDLLKNSGHHSWYYATVFQAAHDYYYKDILNLHRPQLNNTLSSQMKIAAMEVTSASVHLNQFALFGIFPSIYLQAWARPSETIYGTTIHELAHSAHSEMGKNAYNSLVWKAYIDPERFFNDTNKYKSAKRVIESWATAVEITLTNLRYQRLGITNNQYEFLSFYSVGNKQWMLITNDDDLPSTYYTPAFYDLTDNVNQKLIFWLRNVPNDKMSGFTIKQVEDMVKNSRSWAEVKEKFILTYPLNQRGINASALLGLWQ